MYILIIFGLNVDIYWYIALPNVLFLICSPQVSDRPQRWQTRGPQKDAQCLPKPCVLQEGFPRAEDALFLQARQCELPTIPNCFFVLSSVRVT